jgi:hypothetical protein
VLSDYVSDKGAVALLCKSVCKGDATSACNLAITHRNRGDMLGYRIALHPAARLDPDAADELRRFMTRFPERVMGKFGRLAQNCE